MTTPASAAAEGPDRPDRPDGSPNEVEPQVGGLVQLGAADAVVCEDGVCWVPPAHS